MTIPSAPNDGRLSAGGVALLAAVGVALVVAGAFVKLGGLDVRWMLAAHAQPHAPLAIVAWSCLTVLGLGWSALIGVLAADRRSGRLATMLIATFVIGGLLAHVPKRLLHVPRPAATDVFPHLHVIGQVFSGAVSMPSGHAVTAAGMLGLLWVVSARARHWPVAVPLALLAVLIALSRVMVGAHWPSDVLVGSGVGFLAVVLAAATLAWPRTRRLHEGLRARIGTPIGQACVGAVEVGLAYGLLHERTGYPAAQPLVVVVAAVAVGSALLRWVGVLRARKAAAVPAEPPHLEQP